MIYGVANYDYIIRKRDIFFQQRVYYDMYLTNVNGELNFDYAVSIDIIQSVPAELEATLTLNSTIDFDVIENESAELYGEDYIEGSLNITPVDMFGFTFDYGVFVESSKFKGTSVDIYELNANNANVHIGSNVILESYNFAELGLDETFYFDYNIVITSVGIVDLNTLIGNLGLTSACQCLTVDFLEFGIETDISIGGELEAIGIDIYDLILQEKVDYIEDDISLDKVEFYHSINETIEHHIGYDFPLDCFEIIEQGWEFLIHFEGFISVRVINVVDVEDIYGEISHDYNVQLDLVSDIQDLGFTERVLSIDSEMTLDIIAGYIYFDFSEEIMHFDGNVSFFLTRDRYANNEEFLDLNTSTFLDLSIEDFFEVNV